MILVVTKADGGALSPADLDAVQQAHQRMMGVNGGRRAARTTDSLGRRGQAALAPVALKPDLTGFELSDTVTALRAAARAGLPTGLVANVTGGPRSAPTSRIRSPAPT